ncbi:hypothetical protein Syun_025390 [Stephania yunnanensis]|uniref:Uncharacterized protein n=1 Tax=Stephania yunnanensis TaxID=152371 RepID=A0AAP0EU70_9MAGN
MGRYKMIAKIFLEEVATSTCTHKVREIYIAECPYVGGRSVAAALKRTIKTLKPKLTTAALKHTYLPGMKIGLNLKLGTSWSLRAWKSPDDEISVSKWVYLDHPSCLSSKRRRETFGELGHGMGKHGMVCTGMRPNPIVNHGLVNDPNEIYTTYTCLQHFCVSRVMLDYLGFVRRKTWVDSTWMEHYRILPG